MNVERTTRWYRTAVGQRECHHLREVWIGAYIKGHHPSIDPDVCAIGTGIFPGRGGLQVEIVRPVETGAQQREIDELRVGIIQVAAADISIARHFRTQVTDVFGKCTAAAAGWVSAIEDVVFNDHVGN